MASTAKKAAVADTASAANSRSALSEVVVNKVKARVATVAPPVSTPVVGWADFDSYLSDHNKFKEMKSGQFVELTFLIDAEGSPSDIKITKGASPEFNEEAIRLIKEGPKWEHPGSASARVSYTVAF